MINNTDSLYPGDDQLQVPQGRPDELRRPGRRRPGRRAADPVWMKTPGDPRNIYIPRLEWAGNSREVVLQQLNRLQNTQPASSSATPRRARSGRSSPTRTRPGSRSWTTSSGSTAARRLLWLSERDGWQHAYSCRRDGGDARLLTPGDYDVLSVDAVDEKGGWLYVTASPDDATKRFLYRVRMDGKGKPERVGPAGADGRPPLRHLALGPLGLPHATRRSTRRR